jgi:hypothetical protein
MKYCTNCHRITTVEPLFCNICGSSYNVKFCPRLHPNPRAAQTCSQCGSRELSTPQPKPGFGSYPFLLLVKILPGVALGIATVFFAYALIHALISARQLVVPLLFQAGSLLLLAWVLYSILPEFLQKILKRIAHAMKRSGKHSSDHKGTPSGHR